MDSSTPLYKREALQRLTGPVLRPGGLDLTRESAVKCGLKQGDRVLDVGCGRQAAAELLGREFLVRPFGIDMEFQMLSSAFLPAVQALSQELPFKAHSFDALFCECVLSLTSNMEVSLTEFKRVLEPGGVMVFCDLYLREPKFSEPLKDIPLTCGFRQAMGKEDLQNSVARAGFTTVLWEDISPLLTQLAGQAIFEHGSLQKFWAGVFAMDGSASRHCEAIRASRPGYFRIIARTNK